ncbi:MAG: hypothetical protein M0009_17190 [Deltaproteobacteria bacterium]|nr:hypothetical protein [Deltaproteobacteria bacterium]
MKNILVFTIIIVVVSFSSLAFTKKVANPFGMDWNTDGPSSKSWIKVTDIHYLDKNSVKKTNGSIYQARLCNEMKIPKGGVVWNYFNVRIDCKTKQAYSLVDGKWMGPANLTDEDKAVMKYACK